MKRWSIVFIGILFLVTACPNQKKWEESLKQWEQAVKERDAIIADLQAQLKTCQQAAAVASPTTEIVSQSPQSVVGGTPLTGTWKRIGDQYAGAIVECQQAGDLSFSVLKHAGDLTKTGFKDGDVKWKEIVPTGMNTWKGKDLGKTKMKEAAELLGETVAFDATFSLKGDTLTITTDSSTQVWIRQ